MKIKNVRYWNNIRLQRNTWNWKPFEEIPYPIEFQDNYLKSFAEKVVFCNGDELKPQQLEVINEIKDKKSSLVWAKTSFGKSYIISALADIWGGNTLVLVPSVILVDQQRKVMEELLGEKVGVVKTGKSDIRRITVTTTRSFQMGKFKDHQIDNLIIDECDKAFTELIRNRIVETDFKRIVGLTGTIDRAEDLESPNWKEYDDLSPKGSLTPQEKALPMWYRYLCEVKTDMKETPLEAVYYREYHNKKYSHLPHKEWIKFREELDEDRERKIAQFNFIQETREDDKYILVLFDRVNDIKAFQGAYKKRGFENVYVNHGNEKGEMDTFKKTGGIMLAMYSTVGRGFDFPPLTKLYLMFPIKTKTNILQNIGRVIRKLKGKTAFVYYWNDKALDFQRKNFSQEVKKEFELTIKKI